MMEGTIAAPVPPLSKSRHPRTPGDNLNTPIGAVPVHDAHAPGLPFSPCTASQTPPA